jgi:hypothetical protein
MTQIGFVASGRVTAEIKREELRMASTLFAAQLLMTCHSEEPRDEESASRFASKHDKRIREMTNA